MFRFERQLGMKTNRILQLIGYDRDGKKGVKGDSKEWLKQLGREKDTLWNGRHAA